MNLQAYKSVKTSLLRFINLPADLIVPDILYKLVEDIPVRNCLAAPNVSPVPLSRRVRGVSVEQISAQVDREKYIAVKSLKDTAVLLFSSKAS